MKIVWVLCDELCFFWVYNFSSLIKNVCLTKILFFPTEYFLLRLSHSITFLFYELA
jgi:hypothetical protein